MVAHELERCSQQIQTMNFYEQLLNGGKSKTLLIKGIVREVYPKSNLISTVIIRQATVYYYSEDDLIDNLDVQYANDILECECLSSKIDALELKKFYDSKAIVTLIGKLIHTRSGYRLELRRDSGAELVALRTKDNLELMESKVMDDDSEGLYEINAQITKDIEFLENRAQLGEYVPFKLTRSQINQITLSSRVLHQELITEYGKPIKRLSSKGLSTIDETIDELKSHQSEREGLKKSYIEHLQTTGDSEPMFVIVKGTSTDAKPNDSRDGIQITIEDVSIYKYNVNVRFEDSPLIDRVSHINSIIKQQTFNKFEVHFDKSRKRKERVYLGRVILYRRNHQRSLDNNTSNLEVGIQIIQFANADGWIRKASNQIESQEYEDAIKTLSVFSESSFILVDTTKTILDDVMNDYSVLINKLNSIKPESI